MISRIGRKRRDRRAQTKTGDSTAASTKKGADKNDINIAKGMFNDGVLPGTVTFKVDAKAKTADKAGKTPIVSRLLRFPPG